ncbi:glycosyl transferase family 2 [Bacillus sp. AFS041924]|uniref:glycosyl transferase family 2 n=1 Tax=Bacillus sp. AFS041924 TaxID=2033503 RepID=UPI000BFBAF8C|nr:glycosyl transferase family 2 [Bacillus sp. AFS041924]PGS49154.1 glycosyl transferase family 2 [Bacillus sp. AFS041924]
MLDKYRNIHTTYEKLNDIDIIQNTPFILIVNWDSVDYEFLVRANEASSDLLVFGSGAYEPAKMKPPIFQRHSWTEHFDSNMIYYNDPTLYLGQMSLGWGHGTDDTFYLEKIAKIIEKLMNRLSVKAEDTLFYGSSGGGFMSMVLAGFIRGAKALVNNPQTIIPNYYQSHVNLLLEAAHPNLTPEESAKKYITRLNVLEFFKEINYMPYIFYLQNTACNHDVVKHFMPFVRGLNTLKDSLTYDRLTIELYSNKEQGHNPLELDDTIHYIKQIKNK